MKLESKVAFVTGGASGIGLGMVEAFLLAGMKVVIADVRQDHLDSAASALEGHGETHYIPLDVTDRKSMESAAIETVRVYGKVHVLCNNAGIGIMAGAKEGTYDDWDWSMGVNLTGIFNGIHSFLPEILKHGEGGHIVNTASIGALLPANVMYAAAKCGVMGMTEALNVELANDPVGVTCLMPGPVKSNIHEVALLRPEEYQDTQSHLLEADLKDRKPRSTWMESLRAGQIVVDAIERNLLFAFTHVEHRDGVAERFKAILSSFPPGDIPDDAAEQLGFRVSNPVYKKILDEAESPAGYPK